MADKRDQARAAFLAGVAAADPHAAVLRRLRTLSFPADAPLILIAVGKAAIRMMQAAQSFFAVERIAQAIAVTNYENVTQLDGVDVYGAAHPVPDENGLNAASAIMTALKEAGPEHHVLALISGGASALLPAPVAPITLAEKSAVNALLLSNGLDITDMNLVRQALSELKGGGMLRMAVPASVTSLILSDVIGDDLRVVASGPSVGPIGSRADARALLHERGLFAQLPASVQAVLETEKPFDLTGTPDAHLIGSNGQSVQAMAAALTNTHIVTEPLIGDVSDAVNRLLQEIARAPDAPAIAFGGETTVTLRGTGRGGRNQELALRFAQAAKDRGLAPGWVFLSGGTDGRDGPTDAAGGLVDDGTLDRIKAAGADIDALLMNNDSYAALAAAHDLLMTEATGTNVADLQLFISGA